MSNSAANTGWVCEKCGRRFAKVNQEHVCETWTLDDHLADQPKHVRDLFERFIAVVAACGAFEYSITKGNIGLRGTRRIFAGVMPAPQGLKGYLDVPYPIEDARIRRSSPYTKRLFVNVFEITAADQLDETFAGWIRDAYAVGQGDHLKA